MMRRCARVVAGVLMTTVVVACTPAASSPVRSGVRSPSAPPTGNPASPTQRPAPAASARVVGSPVLDVTFVSATHGWALTPGALYETTDSGQHWSRARLPGSSLTHVRFVDRSVGYVWNADGQLWVTTDDTHTWRHGGLSEVDSLEPTGGVVWAVAGPLPYGDVWRSAAGSTSWMKLGATPNRGGQLLPHGSVTYVLGEQGAGPVAPSFDVYVAGRKTRNESLPCERPARLVPQSPMAVSTDASLFLVCDVEAASAPGRQLAYTSTDRGRTWTPATPPPNPVSGVAAARGARLAWNLDIWAYHDGRWRLSLRGPSGPSGFELGGFKLVGFQDDTHAVALTSTGQLYLTGDAGRSWRMSVLPSRLPAADCRTRDLRVRGGRQGGGGFGTAHVDIEITNVGSHSCALPSPSAAHVVDSGGKRLPIEILGLHNAAGAGAVALLAGGRAALALSWQNWCGRHLGPLSVALTVGTGGTATGAFDGPPDYDYWPGCVARSKPSFMQVLDAYALT